MDAHYCPPIKRGDLAMLPVDTKAIGIIDGEFYQSLAVTPKEILELLERGIIVYGASSMGALRATELHAYGMIGIGEIFRKYKEGVIDADDEVAQLYEPQTFAPCSQPLVNIRHALELAVRSDLIARCVADRLILQLKTVYFPYRSYQLVSQLCPELRDFLQVVPSSKGEDAKLLLQLLKKRLQANRAEDN